MAGKATITVAAAAVALAACGGQSHDSNRTSANGRQEVQAFECILNQQRLIAPSVWVENYRALVAGRWTPNIDSRIKQNCGPLPKFNTSLTAAERASVRSYIAGWVHREIGVEISQRGVDEWRRAGLLRGGA